MPRQSTRRTTAKEWLTAFEIRNDPTLGFSHSTLRRWRTACPQLARKINAKQGTRMDARGRKYARILYSRSDLETIVRFNASQEWFDAAEIARDPAFGFDRESLRRWRNDVCMLLGRKIINDQKFSPDSRGRMYKTTVYAKSDLERIASLRRAAANATSHNVPNGWIAWSDINADARCDFSEKQLKAWARGGCPYLPNHQALDKKQVPVTDHLGRCSPRGIAYRKIHVETVLSARAATADGWLTRSEIADHPDYGYPVSSLRCWSTKGCPYLGGHNLESQARCASTASGHRRKLHSHRVVDIETIKLAKRALSAGKADASSDKDTWPTAREIASDAALGFPTYLPYDWSENGCVALGGLALESRTVSRLRADARHVMTTVFCPTQLRLIADFCDEHDTPARNLRINPRSASEHARQYHVPGHDAGDAARIDRVAQAPADGQVIETPVTEEKAAATKLSPPETAESSNIAKRNHGPARDKAYEKVCQLAFELRQERRPDGGLKSWASVASAIEQRLGRLIAPKSRAAACLAANRHAERTGATLPTE